MPPLPVTNRYAIFLCVAIAVFPHGFFLFLLQLRTSVSPFGAVSDTVVDFTWDSGYRLQYVHYRKSEPHVRPQHSKLVDEGHTWS